jgi:hypothetical protein
MAGIQWGRLQADVNCALRRGAWYRVTAIGGLEATVDVGRKAQSVPTFLLQIVSAPPRRWTVVPRPDGAVRMPREWTQYAVCPSCRERAALPARGRPRSLTCGRCRGEFHIDWSEGYLSE